MSNAHQQVQDKYVVTTVGELERESKSRRFNAVEGVSLYIWVQAALWLVAFPLGRYLDIAFFRILSVVLLAVCVLYQLLVSPFLHRDTPESWGLGNPFRLWQTIKQSRGWKRAGLIGIICGLLLVMNVANYALSDKVAALVFYGQPISLGSTSANSDPWQNSHNTTANIIRSLEDASGSIAPDLLSALVLLTGLLLSLMFVTCVIRYDNFVSAFIMAMRIALPLVLIFVASAYLLNGPDAFRGISPALFVVNIFLYLFWGTIQQLAFASYLGTRMRKAFAPTNARPPATMLRQRIGFSLKVGAVAAVLASAGFVLLRVSTGPLPAVLLIWFFGISFLFGTAWGYYYVPDPRRMLVATLCGVFFGLIHIGSNALIALTFVLGVCLSYVFMQDKYRNVVALGFIHGLLGTTLFTVAGNENRIFYVDGRTGPWAVPDAFLSMMVLPVAVLFALMVLLVWCIRNVAPTSSENSRN